MNQMPYLKDYDFQTRRKKLQSNYMLLIKDKTET